MTNSSFPCPQIAGNIKVNCTNSKCGFFIKDQRDYKNCGMLLNIAWVNSLRKNVEILGGAYDQLDLKLKELFKEGK